MIGVSIVLFSASFLYILFVFFYFVVLFFFFFFFFFQAEDGIRDLTVTGVQTCALPILPAGFIVADGIKWTSSIELFYLIFLYSGMTRWIFCKTVVLKDLASF